MDNQVIFIIYVKDQEKSKIFYENILGENSKANGIPRNEIYLYVDDPDAFYDRIIMNGGSGISSTALRNWGDYAAYGMDLDGNILAFAKKGEV